MGVGFALREYRADLHVHTVLSPCAAVEMIPPLIVQQANDRGINLIAITDHNSTANIAAVQKAAQDTSLVVLPGMELQTIEEVHVLCLFDTLEQVNAWQTLVDPTLPSMENNPDFFGEQFVVDETGDYLRTENRMLLTSSSLSISQAWESVNQLGGILIPAHVNRKAFGLIANLGFVPTDIQIEALEISRHLNPKTAVVSYPQIAGYPLIQNGDVHYLDDFLGATYFFLEEPSISEIRMALQTSHGRRINLQNPDFPC